MTTDDIVAIQQVQALYGHAVDFRDQSMLALVFTPDAVFDGRPCGSEIYRGLAAIEAFFALGKPPHPDAHLATNCWIREQGDRVLVKSKFLFRHPLDGTICFGDYDDEMVQVADGWRIASRLVTPRDPARQPAGPAAGPGSAESSRPRV